MTDWILFVRALINLAVRFLTALFDQYPVLKDVLPIVLAIIVGYLAYRFAKKMFFGIVTPILYVLAIIAIVALIGWIQYPTQFGQAWDIVSTTYGELTSYYQEAKELLGWAQQAKAGADTLNETINNPGNAAKSWLSDNLGISL